MTAFLTAALRVFNELITAGIAITAFSLQIYALSFNLRDRVARSFAIIMLCVVIVFVGDALGGVAPNTSLLEFWLSFEWVGIVFVPAAYLQFSNELLTTTGRPSRGRRLLAVRLAYLVSFAFLITLPFKWLVGPLVQTSEPAPHLQRTALTSIFTIYYAVVITLAGVNLWRAYRRAVTSASRRRMGYLLAGSLAPALGVYPYLLFGYGLAARYPIAFWLAVTISNLLVITLIVVMAYAVAFFGVSWPDRVIKRRLFKWLMRGPFTASFTLAATTILRRLDARIVMDLSAAIPVVMVGTVLIIEHIITLIAPVWERWLFYGGERSRFALLQMLEERLQTAGDLRQFLEALLGAACDRFQVPRAFVAALGPQGMDQLVFVGGDSSLNQEDFSNHLLEVVTQNGMHQEVFSWGEYWLLPIFNSEEANGLIGLFGVMRHANTDLDKEQIEALEFLADRACMALSDRRRQQEMFSYLQELTPQMERFQQLRAAASYDKVELFSAPVFPRNEGDFFQSVKEALAHYWGGPKLTQSPLINLNVVQQTIDQQDETPTNALRAVLRKAIEEVRPAGERRFTAEWILYNILEMKFLEGRKVREIAARLAMSEADLYRKQRVAIEAVAQAILDMEQHIRETPSGAIQVEANRNSQINRNSLKTRQV